MSHKFSLTGARAALAAALLLASSWAQALSISPYNEQALQQLKQSGAAVAVFFHADWCPTCRKQAASLEVLKDDTALKDMTVLVANYDNEKELRRALKVRSQSIMVVYSGEIEVTRVLGQTEPEAIKSAFTKAL